MVKSDRGMGKAFGVVWKLEKLPVIKLYVIMKINLPQYTSFVARRYLL